MVKLRVIRGFLDLEARRYRPAGELFETNDDRAKEILSAGVAEIMEVLENPVEEVTAEKVELPKNKKKKG